MLQKGLVADGSGFGDLVKIGAEVHNMLRELLLQLLDQLLPALAGQVHFVDKEEGRYMVAPQQVPEGQGVGLDAVGAVDDQHGAVENGHGPLCLGGEVHMARGVHQGHVQMLSLHQRQLGENGDATAALEIMGIQKRIPMIHPTHLPPHTRPIKQRLGKGSLTGIHMGQQTRTTWPFFHLFGHKECPLSWIISSIIPREGTRVDIFLQGYRKNVVLLAHIICNLFVSNLYEKSRPLIAGDSC